MELSESSTEELVKRFGDEYERYWILSNGLTLEESRGETGRKDLEQKRLCRLITEEIHSRSSEEILKLKVLLDDPRPGVRLMAARALQAYDFDAAVSTYAELAQPNLGPDGYVDPYSARARMALDRFVTEGRAPQKIHPDYVDS